MKTANYLVKFRHEEYTPKCPERLLATTGGKMSSKVPATLTRDSTTCIITFTDTPEDSKGLSVSATVGRFYKDVPNRNVARREAFKKAVSQIPDKSLRAELWESFKSTSSKCLNC